MTAGAFKLWATAMRTGRNPFLAHYLDRRRVLDIGCGRGDFLALDPTRRVGIDIDSELVAACRARGLDARLGDALRLDFADGAFEGVHASQLIEHFEPSSAARLLGEIARVLAPGGLAVLTTPGVRNVWNTFSHIRPYPPVAFRKLLGSATEGYVRSGQLPLRLVGAWGTRFAPRSRVARAVALLLDLIWTPSDPIGWTLLLERVEAPAGPGAAVVAAAPG